MNVDQEVAALRRQSVRDLRERFAQLFGDTTPTTNNRMWLIKRIAWRMQALAEGDLSQRARQRALELANDADVRLSAPRSGSDLGRTQAHASTRGAERALRPGTVLTRVYKGQTLHVLVLAAGFQFEGTVYSSLSAVAKAITGTHCSGHLFFRLTRKGGKP
jgi:hypothetical protein